MESIVDFLITQTSALLGFSPGELKKFFYSSGLGWLWDFIRDYVFNYKVWILGFVPAILLEIYRPVFRKKILTPNLVLDLVYPLLLLPLSLFVFSVVVAAIKSFYDSYIPWANLGLLNDSPIWVQAIGVFLVTDMMFYWSHRLSHEIPWLWHFHTIHHSQTEMNPMTTNRSHPGEGVYKTIIRALPIGIVGGEQTTWVVYLVLNNFWGYFIHSNVQINLGPLKRFIVTPQYHRVHHSIERKHFDKNYGERLVLWDWLFGTHYNGYDDYPRTGVRDTEWILEKGFSPIGIVLSFSKQMIYPFYKIGVSIFKFSRSVFRRA